jgi:hypothetical protein
MSNKTISQAVKVKVGVLTTILKSKNYSAVVRSSPSVKRLEFATRIELVVLLSNRS